jgi:tetratricopeptide (TPR) repeat protein
MTDPLRIDHLPEAGDVPERERDARVEELLLAGLDHYFGGQHELAISVWTRVLFLDRGHARAKAYIDRARSAIAEQQREGDELLQTGAAAFDRGDAGVARTLLTSAVERGAQSEEALVLLERLNRFEPTRVRPARSVVPAQIDALPDPGTSDRSGSSRVAWIATGVLAGLATAGVVAWIALTRPDWLPLNPASTLPRAAAAEEPLPLPKPSEALISRGRALYEDGRLRDALRVLDAVTESDPLRRDADELRAEIQRKLLEVARIAPVPSPAGAGGSAQSSAPGAPPRAQQAPQPPPSSPPSI